MLCWISKWIVACRLDDGGQLPPRVRNHLAVCATCRDQYEQERRVVDRLAASTRQARREAPQFLHARIMARVNSSARPTEARSFSTEARSFSSAFVMATIIITGVVVLMILDSKQRGDIRRPVVPSPVAVIPSKWPPVNKLASTEAVLLLAAKVDEPLTTELHRVMDDARIALTSLSENFLPDSLLADLR